MTQITSLYRRLVGALSHTHSLVLLLIRLVIGIVFVQSGWGKLHNLPKVIEFFESLKIPAPQIQAPFVASTELICGGLLVLGLATRLASLPLIITMIVALVTAKKEDISGFTDLFAIYEFLYILMMATLISFGPGRWALDRWVDQKLNAR